MAVAHQVDELSTLAQRQSDELATLTVLARTEGGQEHPWADHWEHLLDAGRAPAHDSHCEYQAE